MRHKARTLSASVAMAVVPDVGAHSEPPVASSSSTLAVSVAMAAVPDIGAHLVSPVASSSSTASACVVAKASVVAKGFFRYMSAGAHLEAADPSSQWRLRCRGCCSRRGHSRCGASSFLELNIGCLRRGKSLRHMSAGAPPRSC
ncbi:hypothetical protein PF008_g13363 [Phytophthora fragariae]|uniref:Uncharacterized protein n=1 Tax=Phytophthora fragariae TaxID=53985 RepID=A0A6G0RK45_9STRA|nr:hypothetical protein PF008_g13363 [Phytophthora fragariae]